MDTCLLKEGHCTAWECGKFHFSESGEARQWTVAFASSPNRLSTETEKGVKSQCCSMQRSRHFFFFSHSCDSVILCVSCPQCDFSSVSIKQTSRKKEMPLHQRLWAKRLLLRSSVLVATSGMVISTWGPLLLGIHWVGCGQLLW